MMARRSLVGTLRRLPLTTASTSSPRYGAQTTFRAPIPPVAAVLERVVLENESQMDKLYGARAQGLASAEATGLSEVGLAAGEKEFEMKLGWSWERAITIIKFYEQLRRASIVEELPLPLKHRD